MKNAYREFQKQIEKTIPGDRIITDPLKKVAIGVDASFYRLVPEIIIDVESEDEVRIILREARVRSLPVTFRAAGTSLSGQSITDSILVRLGRGWSRFRIYDDAGLIQLQPGIIGSFANRELAPFDRKIGPRPCFDRNRQNRRYSCQQRQWHVLWRRGEQLQDDFLGAAGAGRRHRG